MTLHRLPNGTWIDPLVTTTIDPNRDRDARSTMSLLEARDHDGRCLRVGYWVSYVSDPEVVGYITRIFDQGTLAVRMAKGPYVGFGDLAYFARWMRKYPTPYAYGPLDLYGNITP